MNLDLARRWWHLPISNFLEKDERVEMIECTSTCTALPRDGIQVGGKEG